MNEIFYIRVRGNVQGPYTPEELRMMAGRGLFSRAHEVSADRNHWVRASARPDLFPASNQKATPEEVVTPAEQEDADIVLEEILLEDVAPQSPVRAENISTATSPGGEWFYTEGDSQRGPVAFSQLEFLVNSGEVSARDYVWTDGMSQWSTIAERADLFPNARRVATDQVLSKGRFADSAYGADGGENSKKVSGLAIASLVLGLLGGSFLPGLGSILAVVFGHAALKEIRDSTGRIRGGGMATAGLVMGYFVLVIAVTGIIVVLIVAIVTVLRGAN